MHFELEISLLSPGIFLLEELPLDHGGIFIRTNIFLLVEDEGRQPQKSFTSPYMNLELTHQPIKFSFDVAHLMPFLVPLTEVFCQFPVSDVETFR